MDDLKGGKTGEVALTILVWGGIWGIFEATAGYLLHLLPFSVGWLVWYPVASFFMFNVYQRTKRASAVIMIGLLSAGIKLFNLFLPVRIDKVINPAVSIVFEALTLAAVIFMAGRFFANRKGSPVDKALTVLSMNTGWRLLYILYLMFLVPDWMVEVSVISTKQAFLTFFLMNNFFSSFVLFAGYLAMGHIMAPIKAAEERLILLLSPFPRRRAAVVKGGAGALLLSVSIALELIL